MNNTDKTILITGASSGIGKALAIHYASLNFQVILIARNIDNLNTVVSEILKTGGKAEAVSCDVTNAEAFQNVINKIFSKYKRIDIAHLNVGIGCPTHFDRFDLNEFKQVFDTNVYSIINGLNAIVPIMMKQQFGKIVATGSLADSRGMKGSSSYAASKIAVAHIIESARNELARFGIKVILARPGFVKTSLTAKNNYNMPFIITAEKAAKIIIKRVEKNNTRISFPLPMAIITNLFKLMPNCIYDKIMNCVK
jgi:NADP-dependent 3-hydroxy acid dehydrogenase YdfG